MTKAATPATDPNKNALAVTGDAGPPAFLKDQIAQHAGKGTSQAAEDNLIPLIYVLQANSPQVNRRGPDYVEGAKDGDFWLKGTKIVFDGDEGFLFQPCYFDKDFVEWVPRKDGGGLVERHRAIPADAKEVEVESDEEPGRMQKKLIRANGNEVIETRYHVGFVVFPDGRAWPYVIPFKSTGHTVSKQWMVSMNSKQQGADIAPSWACLYRLTTKAASNKVGNWNKVDVQDGGWVSSLAEFERGTKLNAQMASGEKEFESDLSAPAGQSGEGGAADDKNGAM